MRALSDFEIATVSGSKLVDINVIFEKAFDFGALGVLIKAVTVAHPTFSVLAQAYAIGAGVGAVYGAFKSAVGI